MQVGRVRGLPKRPPLATALIVVLIFLGVSGLVGGLAFIAAPDGSIIHAPKSWLEDIPFSNFLIPGLLLFFVVGVLSLLVAAALLWRPAWSGLQRIAPFKGQYWGWTATGLAGFGIIIFEIVESAFIGLSWPQMLYGGIGIAILVLALSPPVREYYRARRHAGPHP
jgi:hypothetical protein